MSPTRSAEYLEGLHTLHRDAFRMMGFSKLGAFRALCAELRDALPEAA